MADWISSGESSESEAEINTIGNVPLRWYDGYEHIGYTRDGEPLRRRYPANALQQLIAAGDDPENWRKLYDEKNDREIELTDEDVKLLVQYKQRLLSSLSGDEEIIAWAPRQVLPLHQSEEPKRRFLPSKHEAARIRKIIRGLEEGRIVPLSQRYQQRAQQHARWRYPQVDVWTEDDDSASDTLERKQSRAARARARSYVAAPKLAPPGHIESYNPPDEALPTPEERDAWERAAPEDRLLPYLPQRFSSLRAVPAYKAYVEERYKRCLDLYLCPRVLRRRMQTHDPTSLLPELPDPSELAPFPARLSMTYSDGSQQSAAALRCVAVHPQLGHWLATGSDDGLVRVFDVITGALVCRLDMCARHSGSAPDLAKTARDPVVSLVWLHALEPSVQEMLLLVAVGRCIYILRVYPLIMGQRATGARGDDPVQTPESAVPQRAPSTLPLPADVQWRELNDEDCGALPRGTLLIEHGKRIRHVAVHARSDYIAVVGSDSNGSTVYVHQLSRRHSQTPFRKHIADVQCTAFHPSRPFFFVATMQHIRVYSLATRSIVQKLTPRVRWLSTLDIQPGGDNVLCGSYEKRLCWFDLDYGEKPYRVIRNHSMAVRKVCFHPRLPLFASAGDDGTVHVFHATVYDDLGKDPLLVPLRILHGHQVSQRLGVFDIAFHPRLPWLFSVGADGACHLWTEV
jgi:ribosome biogenesis protein ERB1